MARGIRAYTRDNALVRVNQTGGSVGVPDIVTDTGPIAQDTLPTSPGANTFDQGPVTDGGSLNASTIPSNDVNAVPHSFSSKPVFGQGTTNIGGVDINRPNPIAPQQFNIQPPQVPTPEPLPTYQDPTGEYQRIAELMPFLGMIGGDFGARILGDTTQAAVGGARQHAQDVYNQQLGQRNARQQMADNQFAQAEKLYEQQSENNRDYNRAVTSYNSVGIRQYNTEVGAATKNQSLLSGESMGLWAGMNEQQSDRANKVVTMIGQQMNYLDHNAAILDSKTAEDITAAINTEIKQLQAMGILPKDTQQGYTMVLRAGQIDPAVKAKLDEDLLKAKLGFKNKIDVANIYTGAANYRAGLQSRTAKYIANLHDETARYLGELTDDRIRDSLLKDAEEFKLKFKTDPNSPKGRRITDILNSMKALEPMINASEARLKDYSTDIYSDEETKAENIERENAASLGWKTQFNDLAKQLSELTSSTAAATAQPQPNPEQGLNQATQRIEQHRVRHVEQKPVRTQQRKTGQSRNVNTNRNELVSGNGKAKGIRASDKPAQPKTVGGTPVYQGTAKGLKFRVMPPQ